MIKPPPAQPSSPMPHHASFILHERAHQHFWHGPGLLSIKSFVAGRGVYSTDAGQYTLDQRGYLVLNHQQPYTLTIDSPTPVESFCVFFAPDLARDVHHNLRATTDHLLSSPHTPDASPPMLFDKLYAHNDLVSPLLDRLRIALDDQSDPGWITEQLHVLMHRLLTQQRMVDHEIAALSAVRPATRHELYRRLYLAREFAANSFDHPITLEQIAQVAGLSPNHLLRTFKQLFGQTPHQFIVEQRLDRARTLLSTTDRSVTDICFAVGFSSVGSFSWLFRRRVGVSPQAYRDQSR